MTERTPSLTPGSSASALADRTAYLTAQALLLVSCGGLWIGRVWNIWPRLELPQALVVGALLWLAAWFAWSISRWSTVYVTAAIGVSMILLAARWRRDPPPLESQLFWSTVALTYISAGAQWSHALHARSAHKLFRLIFPCWLQQVQDQWESSRLTFLTRTVHHLVSTLLRAAACVALAALLLWWFPPDRIEAQSLRLSTRAWRAMQIGAVLAAGWITFTTIWRLWAQQATSPAAARLLLRSELAHGLLPDWRAQTRSRLKIKRRYRKSRGAVEER